MMLELNAMESIAIIVYVVLSFILAWYGGKKNIGFLGALILSLIFSPLIGFFFVSLSKRKDKNDDSDGLSKKPSTEFDIEQFRKN